MLSFYFLELKFDKIVKIIEAVVIGLKSLVPPPLFTLVLLSSLFH